MQTKGVPKIKDIKWLNKQKQHVLYPRLNRQFVSRGSHFLVLLTTLENTNSPDYHKQRQCRHQTAWKQITFRSFVARADTKVCSNWNTRLLPNPVGRIPKTSFLSAVDRKQCFCSSLSHGMRGKSFSESPNALSNSSLVNREDATLNMEKSCLLKSRRDILWRRAVYSNRMLRADWKADVNQTCQQSVFSPMGACIRIWCTAGAVERRPQMFVHRPFRFSLSPVPHLTKGLFTDY